MDKSIFYLYNGEIKDTGYGFTNNKGKEVCSDVELEELEDSDED